MLWELKDKSSTMMLKILLCLTGNEINIVFKMRIQIFLQGRIMIKSINSLSISKSPKQVMNSTIKIISFMSLLNNQLT